MAQVPVSTVEFCGFPDTPWLRVDDVEYGLDADLDVRHGFEFGATLSVRLFRCIVALAIARVIDRVPDGGWRSADDLALTVDDSAPVEGTRKFLWRCLRPYTAFREREIEFDSVPKTHLVQYQPLRRSSGVLTRGRTRGPYRLGVAPAAVRIDLASGWRFLGHSQIDLPSDNWSLPAAIAYAERCAGTCDYLSARAALLKALHAGITATSEKARRSLVADAYHLLGQYGVQLRFPHDALRCARSARSSFEALRHPAGVAHALLTESHAASQLGNPAAAIRLGQQARSLLDNVAPHRRIALRAECAGIKGGRYSDLREFEAAERNLRRAFELAQDADDPRQVCLWMTRRAENSLKAGHLEAADRHIGDALALHRQHGIMGMERSALWRATAQFLAAAGRRDEADRWTGRAIAFARRHRLDNQLVRLTGGHAR